MSESAAMVKVEEARSAAAHREWHRAYDLFVAADGVSALGVDDLEAMAEAAWWTGRLDAAIGARERAYSACTSSGDVSRGARLAVDIAYDQFAMLSRALGTGWVRRAKELLDGHTEVAAHGHLARIEAMIAFEMDSDFERSLGLVRQAAEIARRVRDRDLEMLALHDQGRNLAAMGTVDEGMALMDAAMVAAVGGELGPLATGKIYCNMISICQKMADYGRAGDWTEAARRWCEREGHNSGFPGLCRVHRAEIMRLRGAWTEAEQEARRACTELEHFVGYSGEALHEVGEIRMRLGDLVGAEAAFRQALECGRRPVPGLAQLRLVQGKPEAAAALLDEALASTTLGPLDRARLLPARIEVAVEEGDLESAAAAASELESIAASFSTTALKAVATQSRGLVALASGDPSGAAAALAEAGRLWLEVDLPYEAARARLAKGRALLAAGSLDLAEMELQAARSVFLRLGARLDAVEVDHILGDRPSAGRRLRTLMFTDIVESTRLIETIGDTAWEHLARWHDETLRDLFSRHGGSEIDHAGDGFFVEFDDASSATACASAVQRALDEHRRRNGFAPMVRIGIHCAELSGGLKGRGVHMAARIAGSAGGGEIVASREAADAAGLTANSETRFLDLKGFDGPVEVITVSWS